jgi:hypothetical protein
MVLTTTAVVFFSCFLFFVIRDSEDPVMHRREQLASRAFFLASYTPDPE